MARLGETYWCSGCRDAGVYGEDLEPRSDRYGIYVGMFHDACWQETYARTWVFDPGYAGESLEEDE